MSLQLIIQLAIIALIVGTIPLTYAMVKGSAKEYHRFVWLVLFCTFDLILFGAFTRLTDSGLGCPDWPGCYGHSNPLLALQEIQLAQTEMPFGPVSLTKAWIEMLHRYFASGVGFLIIVLVVVAWLKRATLGLQTFYGAMVLLILVCLQGAFGAWTVTLKLQPLIVSMHLLLAMILVIGLTCLGEFSHSAHQQNLAFRKSPSYSLGWPVILLVVSLWQIFLGAWVSTNYAVLACNGFPLCNGELIPSQMDFEHGFTWWRELGKTASGEYLSVHALTAIHWVHRLGALVILLTVIIFWVMTKAEILKGDFLWQSRLTFWRKALMGVIFLQIGTGLSNVVLNWPMIAALAHTGGAALLVICATQLILLALPKPIDS